MYVEPKKAELLETVEKWLVGSWAKWGNVGQRYKLAVIVGLSSGHAMSSMVTVVDNAVLYN